MTWIELHDTVIDHPKVIEAADILGISNVTMVGHLVALWTWAIDAAPEGGPLTDRTIAAGARWLGDKEAFTQALHDCELIDEDGGRWTIHNWAQYSGRLVTQREQSRQRARNARTANANRTRTVREQFTPTVQDSTEQNRTNPLSLSPPQQTMIELLHEQVRIRVLAGRTAPDTLWCDDLVKRGMTESDIRSACDASVGKGLNYVRRVLERRVQEREQGNDPDLAERAGRARGADGDGHARQAQRGGLRAVGAGRAGGHRVQGFDASGLVAIGDDDEAWYRDHPEDRPATS